MELNSEQYERIARWLDGEGVALSGEELAAAGEVRSGEAVLRARLGEAAVPARAMARARRRLRAAAAGRPAVRGRFIGVAAAGAALAASIVVAWALRAGGPAPLPQPGGGAVPVAVWLGAMEVPPGGEAIHLLAGELDRFEAELAISRTPATVDWQLDTVQQEIDSFWQDEPSWETPES
jgi:hypothetical protein